MKSREYKRIYCCGDCVYYDMRKHKCKLGAHVESDAKRHFYDDCPFDTHVEENEVNDESH